MQAQSRLATALSELDPLSPQAIKVAMGLADDFRHTAAMKFKAPEGAGFAMDGGIHRASSNPDDPPPQQSPRDTGSPQLDGPLLDALKNRMQDVFVHHLFDRSPQQREDMLTLITRTALGLTQMAQHSQIYQRQLMNTPGLVDGVLALLSCDLSEANAQAALLMSQVALANAETSEQLVHMPGLLDTIARMLSGRHEHSVDGAALLVNNLAGMGGLEAIMPMCKHEALMEALIERLETGTPLQLQRVVSATNHLTRSSVSAKALHKRRVPRILVRITNSEDESSTAMAYKGLATMALANMCGKDHASDALSHVEALGTIANFLRAAVAGTSYNGISFRTYDVLYPLAMLSSNAFTHRDMLQNGALDNVLKVVVDWEPGKYAGQFSAMRASTYPVLEVATDVMYELSHTPACRERMLKLGIMPCLERLVAHDSDSVQTHAAKVLWAIRDREDFLQHAVQVAKGMDAMAALAGRYNWTSKERTLRVNHLLTEQGLAPRIGDGSRWLLDAVANDKMDVIRMMLAGASEKTLGTCFRAFRAAVYKSRAAQKADTASYSALKAMYRMMNLSISRPFSTWRAYVLDKKRLIANARRIVLEWKNASLSRSYRAWVSMVETKKHMLRVCKKVLAQWQNRTIALALREWVFHFAEHKRITNAADRVLKRWTHQMIYQPFSTWVFRTVNFKHQRAVLAKIVAQMRNRAAAVAIHTWVARTRDVRRLRDAGNKVLRRWTHQGTAHAFLRWQGNVEAKQRLAGIMDRVLRRWTHQSLLAAMALWTEHVGSQKRMVSVAARVVARWTHQTTSHALGRWQSYVGETKRFKTIVSKVTGRWQHQNLLAPFTLWLSHAKDQRRLETAAVKVLARWSHSTQFAVWNRWSTFAREERRMLSLECKVLARWTHGTLFHAWARWMDFIAEIRRMVSLESKVLQIWTHRGTAPAFSSWRAHAKEQARLKLVGSRVLLRWTNMTVSEALLTWYATVRELRRVAKLLEKCVDRWTSISTGKWFRTWRDKTAGFVHARECIENVMKHLTHQAQFKALHRWKELHAHMTRAHEVAAVGLRRWMHQGTAHAFLAWRTAHQTEKRHQRVALTIINRWYKLGLQSAFAGWAVKARHMAEVRDIAEGAILRMLNMSAARAVRSWREHTVREIRHRTIGSRVLARWSNLGVAEALTSWALLTSMKARFERLQDQIAARSNKRAVAHAFDTWDHHLSQDEPGIKDRIATSHSRNVLNRFVGLMVRRAFLSWVHYTFNPGVLMLGDHGEDVSHEIHMASRIRTTDLGDSFEAVLAREIADALHISKSQVLLTSFDTHTGTVQYKIVEDQTGYGRGNREVYSDAMHQLQDPNSRLRQCNVAGNVTSCALTGGHALLRSDISVDTLSIRHMRGMTKETLVATLQGAQNKMMAQEQHLNGLQGKYSTVQMNVGLDITVDAPHYVRSVHDLMDQNGHLQGEAEYSNKLVEPDDILVAIDDHEVADADMDQIRDWLRGPPYSVVSLTFRRDLVLIGEDGESLEDEDEDVQELTYKVRVMRHISAQRLMFEEDAAADSEGVLGSILRPFTQIGAMVGMGRQKGSRHADI